ncbi:MAG TPA: EpsI family protein [Syntrophorhabdus sp.]|jgi:EpsI family protein|nr:EpsI family protein [Syntrophorhabdus sp.]
MKTKNRSFLIVIIVTAITAGVVHAVKSTEPLANDRLLEFPLTIGQWVGREVQMSDYVYESLGTRYAFLRNYSSPVSPNPINLSVVWTDDTRLHAFHAPEECLGGVGNTVKEIGTQKVMMDKEYEIGKLISEVNGRRSIVLFYYDVGGYITISPKDIRLKVLGKRMRSQRATASFVRVMTSVSQSEEEAVNIMSVFLRDVRPVLSDYINGKYE